MSFHTRPKKKSKQNTISTSQYIKYAMDCQWCQRERRPLGVFKINSVQEACAKCFVVHILKFEILQPTWKNKTKTSKKLDLLMKNWENEKSDVLCFILLWDLKDFKHENRNAFGTSFLYWVDFTTFLWTFLLERPLQCCKWKFEGRWNVPTGFQKTSRVFIDSP